MALPTSDVKSSPTDADLYEVGNGDQFSTTLAASITASSPASGEVLELSSTSGLPTNGFLLIKTTNELIRYEGLSASPVGVIVHTRGWGPTTAQEAASGDSVWLVDVGYYHDLLAAYIQRLMSEHNADGSHADMTVTGNIVQSDGKHIATDEIRARGADGLKLYDDGGNGIFVKDGGEVGIGAEPLGKLHVKGPASSEPILYLESTASGGDGYFEKVLFSTRNVDNTGALWNVWGAHFDGSTNAWVRDYDALPLVAYGCTTTGDFFVKTDPTTDGSGPNWQTRFYVKENGNVGIGTTNPGCKLHIDTETTTATDIVFQVESDVTNADTVKARIEADGEFFSDIGFTTFSPVMATDPDEALDQALADAKKAHKPYKGLFPFADLAELADKKTKTQAQLQEAIQRIETTENEITQFENDIAKEPDPERKAEMNERLAALRETLKTHKQDQQRYTKRLAAINHWEQIAKQHGLQGRADEKERWGRDPTRIAMGVALWAEAARRRIAELEAKVAELEAKLAEKGV